MAAAPTLLTGASLELQEGDFFEDERMEPGAQPGAAPAARRGRGGGAPPPPESDSEDGPAFDDLRVGDKRPPDGASSLRVATPLGGGAPVLPTDSGDAAGASAAASLGDGDLAAASAAPPPAWQPGAAASLPAGARFAAPRRPPAHPLSGGGGHYAADVSPLLGTSMPISIPALHRRAAPSPGESPAAPALAAAAGGGGGGAAFVPPHLLPGGGEAALRDFGFGGGSPAASLKLGRLRSRNAILRSTGFLEATPSSRGPLAESIGEVLDGVRAAALGAGAGAAGGGGFGGSPSARVAVPGAARRPAMGARASSLTALLSSSK